MSKPLTIQDISSVDGVLEPKLSTALAALRVQESMTVDELADVIDLSKTAGRARLLRWEEEGWIARDTRDSEGPGRPPLAFRISEKGSAVFPTEDAALLTRLLGYLSEATPGVTERFFDQIWGERAVQFETIVRDQLDPAADPYTAPLDIRLAAVTEVLERSGFMPRVEVLDTAAGKQIEISECNCPLVGAARATRIPCEREARFLSRAIGAQAQAEVHVERRNPCKFRFELARERGKSNAEPSSD